MAAGSLFFEATIEILKTHGSAMRSAQLKKLRRSGALLSLPLLRQKTRVTANW